MGRRKDKRDIPPAPGDLRIFQAFLNTADHDAGSDELKSPRALVEWLAFEGFLPATAELTPADLARTVRIREGWRTLLARGEAAPRELAATLNKEVQPVLLRPRFGPGGEVRFEPAAPGLDGALGRLVAIVAAAQIGGHWSRFKVCASDACRAAFYDFAHTRATKWCRPRCGNRISARLSRKRNRRYRRVY